MDVYFRSWISKLSWLILIKYGVKVKTSHRPNQDHHFSCLNKSLESRDACIDLMNFPVSEEVGLYICWGNTWVGMPLTAHTLVDLWSARFANKAMFSLLVWILISLCTTVRNVCFRLKSERSHLPKADTTSVTWSIGHLY